VAAAGGRAQSWDWRATEAGQPSGRKPIRRLPPPPPLAHYSPPPLPILRLSNGSGGLNGPAAAGHS